MPQEVNIIQIGWEEKKYDEKIIEKLDSEDYYGVYQIYGNHPVYGENTLLYIGKANQQTFAIRLKERTEFKETVLRPSSIRIGRIFKTTDTENAIWDELVDIVEKILIRAHAPAYNSTDIKGLEWYNEKEKHYIIKNWYDYGLLLPEVSSMNISYRYWTEFEGKDEYLGQKDNKSKTEK